MLKIIELNLPGGIVLQDVVVVEVGPLPFAGKLLSRGERLTPTPTWNNKNC